MMGVMMTNSSIISLKKDIQYIKERHDEMKEQVTTSHKNLLCEIKEVRKVLVGDDVRGGLVGQVRSLEKGQKSLWKVFGLITVVITVASVLGSIT